MTFGIVKRIFPSWQNTLLALVASVLLILAFPDFEYWFLAWFALVPLMWAIERETRLQKPARSKGISRGIGSPVTRSFVLGWMFGTTFFFGTCWWLAYAPIHYAAIPSPIAYILIFIPCVISGIFPGIFASILALLLRRFGSGAFLAAPFVWVFTEFARYWLTGNNWNAIGYSQVFSGANLVSIGSIGGVLLVSFFVVIPSCILGAIVFGWDSILANPNLAYALRFIYSVNTDPNFWARNVNVRVQNEWTEPANQSVAFYYLLVILIILSAAGCMYLLFRPIGTGNIGHPDRQSQIVALQPNVPMAGLDSKKWEQFRQRQIDAAEAELRKLTTDNRQPTTVILPESPMNFMYNDDREFQQFVRDFTARNNVSLLFNSAEPDPTNGKYFNSAVMVGPEGREVSQYDKIYLLPFGEAVPSFLEGIVPGFVGNFAYGREYDLLPLGDAKAGVMICFESHFGQLSREYVRNGADAIIEMTNDGYLGPTPVLRQHLANAVFRAVETNRPVLRVTNVGITAYINERGQVHDPLPPYSEGTRVWSVSKSDGSQTFYVKYGDWFAWLCTIVTISLIGFSLRRRREVAKARA